MRTDGRHVVALRPLAPASALHCLKHARQVKLGGEVDAIGGGRRSLGSSSAVSRTIVQRTISLLVEASLINRRKSLCWPPRSLLAGVPTASACARRACAGAPSASRPSQT